MANHFTRKRLITLVVLGVVILLIVSLVIRQHAKNRHQSSIISVATVAALQKDVAVSASAIGTVEPYATVSVRSRVDGQLMELGFKEGDIVKQGQVLFRLDPRPYAAQLAQAQANLAKDTSQLENAKANLARYSKLLKNAFVAQQSYDQAQADASSLEATIKADQAAVDNAQLQLEYATIQAPISGKTGNVLVDMGNLVKGNDTNALVVINQITPIYVKFSLPEENLPAVQAQINKGKLPVQVKFNLESGREIIETGELSFIDNTVDSTTGMIQLKATFQNEDQQLWPGQYVNVSLPLAYLKNAVLVPTRAIQIGQQGSYVYVIDKFNRAKYRLVKTGATIGDNTVVMSGIKPGEQIVVDGVLRLHDNVKVKLQNKPVALAGVTTI